MKKILSVLIALMLVLSVAALAEGETYKIGVCQLMPHPALDAATQGFVDTVKAEFGDNVDIDVQVAGESNLCSTIISGFTAAGSEVDLIMANATDALATAAAGTMDIPILGTSITEYGVALKIPNFTGTVGGNVSGTSDLAPLDEQAAMILEWFPEAKTVGLLYCSAEPNSAYQVMKVREYLEEKGITCTDYSFADSNDLQAVTTRATQECDVIYVPTDNTAANNSGIIDGVCRPAKIPVIAGEEGICKGCGVATLSISYYDLGVATGNMAIRILRDGEDISTMPIEYAAKVTKKYNAEICEELGITPLEGYEPITED